MMPYQAVKKCDEMSIRLGTEPAFHHVTLPKPKLIALGQTVWTYGTYEVPKIFSTLGTRPLGWGRGFPEKTPSDSRSITSVDPPEKNWPLASRLPRALKVIGIEMD